MFKKLMKHLANNPGLKILSLIIAVILWLIVVNYDNPEMTKTYNIPVTVTNDRILEERGKVYEVVGQGSEGEVSGRQQNSGRFCQTVKGAVQSPA